MHSSFDGIQEKTLKKQSFQGDLFPFGFLELPFRKNNIYFYILIKIYIAINLLLTNIFTHTTNLQSEIYFVILF